MHIPNSDKPIKFYNLDVVLSVGYKTNSIKAMEFKKWATSVLKEHITQGWTINKNVIKRNYDEFLKAVEDLKLELLLLFGFYKNMIIILSKK